MDEKTLRQTVEFVGDAIAILQATYSALEGERQFLEEGESKDTANADNRDGASDSMR